MNRIRNKIYVVVAIFLLTAGIATAAILIDKKETLGPYGQGHKYYVHVYNVDDVANATVNGKLVVTENFLGDSGWVDITNDMKKGKNIIEFDLTNKIIGWTFGFALRQDDSNIIFRDECGTVGVEGCFHNDLTKGLVYHNVITIIGAGVHPESGRPIHGHQ